MSDSYRDEILREVDALLRDVPEDFDDPALLLELAAAASDPKRAPTVRPGAKERR